MEIKEGYRQTEIGIIPNDWEIKEFGEITERIVGGGTPSRQNPNFWGGTIPWTTVKDFATFNPYQTQEYITVDGLKNSSSNLIPKRTIITSTRMGLGKAVIYQVDVAINQDLKAIYPKKNIETDFLLNWFYFFSKTIEEMGSGSTVMGLSLVDLRKIKLAIPPTKQEQTAIATALSDTDALIENLEELIEKKRNIKQGVMQELLTGKKRLAGFTIAWNIKKLGDILKLQGGYAFQSDSFQDDGIPIIRISNIDNNSVKLSEVVYYKEFKMPNEFVIKKNDVLIAMSGATTGKVGIYGFDFISYQNQRVGKFVIHEPFNNDLKFISYLIRSEKFMSAMQKEIAQGAQPNISGKQIESLEFSIPSDINEQIAIGTILSDIDCEIDAIEQKLNKYRMIKQAMMQVLLTGKIRLI